MTAVRTPWWGHVLTGVILGAGVAGLLLSAYPPARLGFAVSTALGIVLLARQAARGGT